MPKCGKCSVDLTSKDVVAKCVQCEAVFHPDCTSAGSTEAFKRKNIKTWICDSCKDDTSSMRNTEDSVEGQKIILDALNAMKDEINTNVKSVKDSVDQLSTDVKTLSSKIEALESGQTALSARCDKLELDNKELSDEARELRLQLQEAEQRSRNANVEIVGLPVTKGENIYDCLQKVASVILMPFKREDVSIAHRLRVYSENRHKHPPIIAQFVSRSIRDAWLAASRRKKGFNASDVAPSLPSSAVYINEQLTAVNKALLGRARRLTRENKLYFAGFFNGKILIKSSENSDAVRIRSLCELDRFDK